MCSARPTSCRVEIPSGHHRQFVALRQQVEAQGAALEVLGVGTTGYAKDDSEVRATEPMSRW